MLPGRTQGNAAESPAGESSENRSPRPRRDPLSDQSPNSPNFHARFGIAPSALIPPDADLPAPPELTEEEKSRLAEFRRRVDQLFKPD